MNLRKQYPRHNKDGDNGEATADRTTHHRTAARMSKTVITEGYKITSGIGIEPENSCFKSNGSNHFTMATPKAKSVQEGTIISINKIRVLK